jgi:hypothetical protein
MARKGGKDIRLIGDGVATACLPDEFGHPAIIIPAFRVSYDSWKRNSGRRTMNRLASARVAIRRRMRVLLKSAVAHLGESRTPA